MKFEQHLNCAVISFGLMNLWNVLRICWGSDKHENALKKRHFSGVQIRERVTKSSGLPTTIIRITIRESMLKDPHYSYLATSSARQTKQRFDGLHMGELFTMINDPTVMCRLHLNKSKEFYYCEKLQDLIIGHLYTYIIHTDSHVT